MGSTPISISVPTLLIEVVIFLGMVYLMERLVFGPIRTAWHQRDEEIQAGLQASTETRDEATEAREEVRRILGEARRQVQAAIDQVTAEGNAQRTRRMEEANAEFQRLLEQATAEIRQEEGTARNQMRETVVELALEAAKRVTGAAYDTQEAREIAASVVSREARV